MDNQQSVSTRPAIPLGSFTLKKHTADTLYLSRLKLLGFGSCVAGFPLLQCETAHDD
jgi:hypothetical protein